jgi:hypothetical protein
MSGNDYLLVALMAIIIGVGALCAGALRSNRWQEYTPFESKIGWHMANPETTVSFTPVGKDYAGYRIEYRPGRESEYAWVVWFRQGDRPWEHIGWGSSAEEAEKVCLKHSGEGQ